LDDAVELTLDLSIGIGLIDDLSGSSCAVLVVVRSVCEFEISNFVEMDDVLEVGSRCHFGVAVPGRNALGR
jgi:hypothetical protein